MDPEIFEEQFYNTFEIKTDEIPYMTFTPEFALENDVCPISEREVLPNFTEWDNISV